MRQDVRLLYANMFVNMYNTMDYTLCKGFFDEFCHTDLSFVSTLVRSVSHNSHTLVHIPSSSSVAAQFVFTASSIYPDSAMRLTDSYIVNRVDEESRIVCKTTWSATQIHDTSEWTDVVDFQTNIDHMADSQLQAIPSHTVYSKGTHGQSGQLRLYTVEQSSELLQKSPLLTHPVRIEMQTEIVMFLDSNKKVTRFEHNCLSIDLVQLERSEL
jgi:hypothetical protein